ncbi:MAG: alpha/beta hydrolase family protein [Paracoccaceae bacterium]
MSLPAIACTLAMTIPAAHAENRIDQVRPDAPALAAYGSYPIGVQTMTFINPGQLDVLNTTADAQPTYDRELTVEVWYPAAEGTEPGGTYTANLRDGKTEVTLHGQAARDATPASGETFPLIVISHGYPGNRFLMSHLGENLASKGYVTVSIDHLDSTYATQSMFGSTLLNRPLDQRFVIDSMEALDGPVGDITDTSSVGLIGYSMGGYGALIYGGAGLAEGVLGYDWVQPTATILDRHLAGSDTHEALATDDRLKAIIAVGPWGRHYGFWDPVGISGVRKPLMLMAGSVDDVSSYPAMRQIFEEMNGTDRHLLTFENANHNAAAPMPAPAESWEPVETLDFVPFDHYADAVWDTNRMNNITQHFATAFMDLHVKGDAERADYLTLIEKAGEGVHDLDDDGKPTDAHTYWNGFAPRTAQGLMFETLNKGQ